VLSLKWTVEVVTSGRRSMLCHRCTSFYETALHMAHYLFYTSPAAGACLIQCQRLPRCKLSAPAIMYNSKQCLLPILDCFIHFVQDQWTFVCPGQQTPGLLPPQPCSVFRCQELAALQMPTQVWLRHLSSQGSSSAHWYLSALKEMSRKDEGKDTNCTGLPYWAEDMPARAYAT